MATITVRNLDETVKLALRQRAASRGVSLEEEVRKTLGESVARTPRPRTGRELYQSIRAIVEEMGGIELELPSRGPARPIPDFE